MMYNTNVYSIGARDGENTDSPDRAPARRTGGYRKGDRQKAYEYFSKGLRQEPSNFDLIKNCLLLQVDLEAFGEAESLSKEAMANFPAQPLLYLVNGLANNALGQHEQAIESLELGLDFLFDNPGMQKDFYLQLSIAYKATGDNSRAEEYQRRANQITISN